MTRNHLSAIFRDHTNFLLLIHHSPDGDAIASSLGLALALHQLQKNVDIVCADPIPPQFGFLPWVNKIKHDFFWGDYHVIVTLDCGDSRRTGFHHRLKDLVKRQKKILVNIDHHPKNDLHELATYNFVDVSAPSTSYLVYQVIRDLRVRLDHKVATCLLTGLYTDTGGFKHPNTTAEALNFASLMLAHGARLKDIRSYITQPSSVARLKLWGIALSRIVHHVDFDTIATHLTQDDLKSVGATESDIAGIAALLTSIPAKMAVLAVEMPDGTTQIRLRTKQPRVNLLPLALYFGGGGQKKAAGFAIRNISEK